MSGTAQGLGMYYYSNGSIYEGAWRYDRPNGFGKEIYPGGSAFHGVFLNGEKHGHGVM